MLKDKGLIIGIVATVIIIVGGGFSYQRFKNTLMGTGSQGKNWRQNNDPQMTGIVIYQIRSRTNYKGWHRKNILGMLPDL